MTASNVCPECKGERVLPQAGRVVDCDVCEGTGQQRDHSPDAGNMVSVRSEIATLCATIGATNWAKVLAHYDRLQSALEAAQQRAESAERRAEYWKAEHIAGNARLAELESLLATRNQQNAAAFADRDALLADQRRLLYLASTASMNWGHRDRAGYTLDPMQFESAREGVDPDDLRKAIDEQMACERCHGSGLITIHDYDGNGSDADNQPCHFCSDIRNLLK